MTEAHPARSTGGASRDDEGAGMTSTASVQPPRDYRFMGPPLWMMWHNRCLWTDATAARRTLDPEDLASALEKMTDVPEGAEFARLPVLGRS